jgi:hypothetical protein
MRFIEVESDVAVHIAYLFPENWTRSPQAGQRLVDRPMSWLFALCATHCKHHARCFAIQIRFALRGLT